MESIPVLSTMVSFVWGNYSRASELISPWYTMWNICCSASHEQRLWNLFSYLVWKCCYLSFYQTLTLNFFTLLLLFCACINFSESPSFGLSEKVWVLALYFSRSLISSFHHHALRFIITFRPLIHNIAHFHTIFVDWLSQLKLSFRTVSAQRISYP